MGQKRIKLVDLNKPEKKVKHAGKGEGRIVDMGTAALAEAKEREKKEAEELKKLEKAVVGEAKKEVKTKKAARPKKVRSRRYRQLKTKIDRKKYYPLAEASKLICEIANAKIDETVEVHFVLREGKVSGSVQLPHGTGKQQKVVIADDKVIDAVSKGKIEFDILIAAPSMMGKIAKVARILGPKGLMPNPKTGTISDKPEELKAKLEAGETRFKSEPKEPLLHFVIGKVSFGAEKLQANLEAFIKAVKPSNIKKAFLKSTHSPSIKLAVS